MSWGGGGGEEMFPPHVLYCPLKKRVWGVSNDVSSSPRVARSIPLPWGMHPLIKEEYKPLLNNSMYAYQPTKINCHFTKW